MAIICVLRLLLLGHLLPVKDWAVTATTNVKEEVGEALKAVRTLDYIAMPDWNNLLAYAR